MALFRKLFYRKPPDGLLEISERVYVFDCCFTTDAWKEENYKGYVGTVITQLHDHYPDASILVFNFRDGESQIANVLSEYDMTIMDYPRHYEGCPLLSMEVLHHFLRSSESWLSLGQQNVLLMHCERGGWPVLAFVLSALLIYRKQYSGEQKTLDMVYKQAPRELLHLLTPLNPLPSQLRYLQYVSRRNVASEWPPLDRALTLDCIILRMIPDFDGEGGCRPIFRIYGQDPFLVADKNPKVLYSTPKKSKTVRHYKQDECELLKIDINCHIQGDVVLECISLYEDLERETMMFRVMFNTAFIRSNILMLNRDEIDTLWDSKHQFPKDFRAEVLFSDMDAAASVVPLNLSCFEERDGLPVEAFAKVQEIFSSVDWLSPKKDAALNVLQQISVSCQSTESSTVLLISSPQKLQEKQLPEAFKESVKESVGSTVHSTPEKPPSYSQMSSPKADDTDQKVESRLLESERGKNISSTRGPNLQLESSHIASAGDSTISSLALSSMQPDYRTTTEPKSPLLAKQSSTRPSDTSTQGGHENFSISPSASTTETKSAVPGTIPSRHPTTPPPARALRTKDSSLGTREPPSSSPVLQPPLTPPLKDKATIRSGPLLPPPPPPPPPPRSSNLTTEDRARTAKEGSSSFSSEQSTPTSHKSDTLVGFSPPPPAPPPPPPITPAKVTDVVAEPLPHGSQSKLHATSDMKDRDLAQLTPVSTPHLNDNLASFNQPHRPPPPPTPPLKDSLASRGGLRPPPPPPPPVVPSSRSMNENSSGLRGPPPPPPPPLRVGAASGPANSLVVPPPPPPPSSSALLKTLNQNPSRVPSAPPPPVPSTAGDLKSSKLVSSGRDMGSPSPPLPSVPPPNIKGRSLLSRTMTSRNQQNKKLKPLHWLKLTRAVQGSLWAETQKSGDASRGPEIDISELESLFSAAVPNSDQMGSGRKRNSGNLLGQKSEKVQLIDHRRAYNCEIMLSKVKIPLHDLLNSVLVLEDTALDVDQVENLIKFCPTKEEMELLKGYKGEKDKLGKCEQFFMELMQVPRIESKLRVFSFKMQFHSQVSDLRNSLSIVNSAADQIRGSAKLKRIMQTILSLGNALNQGTARGSAVGFRLDSLLKLTETRARNNKMTLMHYLCKVLADKLPEVLDFSKDLSSLEPASKIQLKFLAEEMQAISKGIEKVVQELATSESDGPVSEKFRSALKEFLSYAEGAVRSLASLYSRVGRNVDALILYFGEDPAKCPFEQVISTLLNFVRMFNQAHEDNCKQLEVERKKAEKEAMEMEKPKMLSPEKERRHVRHSAVKSVR